MGSDDSSLFSEPVLHKSDVIFSSSSQSSLSSGKPPSIALGYLTHLLEVPNKHIQVRHIYAFSDDLLSLLSQTFAFQPTSTTPTARETAIAWLQNSLMPQWRKANNWFLAKPKQVAARLLSHLSQQVHCVTRGDTSLLQALHDQLTACIREVRQQAREHAHSVLSYAQLATKIQRQLGYSKAERRVADEPNSLFHQKLKGVLANLSVPARHIDALPLLVPTGTAGVTLLSSLSFAVQQVKLPKLQVHFYDSQVSYGDLTGSQTPSPRSFGSPHKLSLSLPADEQWPYPHLMAHLHDDLFQPSTSLSSSSSMSKEDMMFNQHSHDEGSETKLTHQAAVMYGDKQDRQSSPAVGDDELDDCAGFHPH